MKRTDKTEDMGRLYLPVVTGMALALFSACSSDPTHFRGASDPSLSAPLSASYRSAGELSHIVQILDATKTSAQDQVPMDRFQIREAGMSLSRLSVVIYGDTQHWKELAEWNGIKNPNRVYLGQIIVLKAPILISQADLDHRILGHWRQHLEARGPEFRPHEIRPASDLVPSRALASEPLTAPMGDENQRTPKR